MKRKTSLACAECGSRNYTLSASGTNKQVRLEVKKFCRHCNKHTLHRETK